MSGNAISKEQGYPNPRVVIIGGAMVKQPERTDNGSFDYFSAMEAISMLALTGKTPHSAEKIYGLLLEQYPQAELVVPTNYGILGDPEDNFEDTKRRIAATEEDPVYLVGHSLGGIYAHRMKVEQPDGVVGVVKIDSPSKQTGIDSYPYTLPFPRAISAHILRPHLEAIRKGRSPESDHKIVAMGSAESSISLESSLHLDEVACNIRRILFRRKGHDNHEDLLGIEVEEREVDGALDHVSLASNPSVIKACAEILGLTVEYSQKRAALIG